MSKYKALWEYVAKINNFPLKLSFDEIFCVLGFPIDHSFLTYKKETVAYGFIVKKVSLKEKIVIFTAQICLRFKKRRAANYKVLRKTTFRFEHI